MQECVVLLEESESNLNLKKGKKKTKLMVNEKMRHDFINIYQASRKKTKTWRDALNLSARCYHRQDCSKHLKKEWKQSVDKGR